MKEEDNIGLKFWHVLLAFGIALIVVWLYWQLPSNVFGDFGCNATKLAYCT